jgi:hypothetical protein
MNLQASADNAEILSGTTIDVKTIGQDLPQKIMHQNVLAGRVSGLISEKLSHPVGQSIKAEVGHAENAR